MRSGIAESLLLFHSCWFSLALSYLYNKTTISNFTKSQRKSKYTFCVPITILEAPEMLSLWCHYRCRVIHIFCSAWFLIHCNGKSRCHSKCWQAEEWKFEAMSKTDVRKERCAIFIATVSINLRRSDYFPQIWLERSSDRCNIPGDGTLAKESEQSVGDTHYVTLWLYDIQIQTE